MKLAHMTVITPGRCGLYETTRELVAGLRRLGVDSRLVDPDRANNKLYPQGEAADRGALFADTAWAKTADFLVSHSGLGRDLEGTSTPVVHVAHGRPRSSFLTEHSGGTPIYSYHYNKNKDPRFKAIITFWPEHEPYLAFQFPDKPVHAITAPVDLGAWTPEGPSGYSFHGNKGVINAVCTDAFREDSDPFTVIHAFGLWARGYPGAKLHIYGVPENRKGWHVLFQRLKDGGALGELCGWVKGLAHVYRAADFSVTAASIATRSVREAMACGCPVVHVGGDDDLYMDWKPCSRESVRKNAEQRFDMMASAQQFKSIVEGI